MPWKVRLSCSSIADQVVQRGLVQGKRLGCNTVLCCLPTWGMSLLQSRSQLASPREPQGRSASPLSYMATAQRVCLPAGQPMLCRAQPLLPQLQKVHNCPLACPKAMAGPAHPRQHSLLWTSSQAVHSSHHRARAGARGGRKPGSSPAHCPSGGNEEAGSDWGAHLPVAFKPSQENWRVLEP